MLNKAKGCFVGLIAGDNLGSLVEFMYPHEINELYPEGFKNLQEGGGVFNLKAGQPTDDGEMAITLAKSIISNKGFNFNYTLNEYKKWAKSYPFDIGITISSALYYDEYNVNSASNGSLMRVAPIGIYGSRFDLDFVSNMAIEDSKCTHNNDIVFETNSIYARAISLAIKSDISAKELFEIMLSWAKIDEIKHVINLSKYKHPEKMANINKGYCLTALGNAMYHLYNTDNVIDAMNQTIKQGGDTDTNSAILGALFGSVYGLSHMPDQWIESINSCEASVGKTSKPRPQIYWPNDILKISEQLLTC
jgi:ADP-ribosyl-[dinitrogen reductase] hydrolase